jgi:hypothetical protein
VFHRACHLFIRQQTAVINSIRAHLAEFGIVAPIGRKTLPRVAPEMALHVLAYNLTRVMNIMGIGPLMAAITLL